MSGLPPFLGFFIKISLITLLINNEEYLLFFLILLSGLFISFFYIQNYRFFGYNLKNINYKKNLLILKYNNSLFFIIYVCIFINIFGIFFLNDFFIFMMYLSLI